MAAGAFLKRRQNLIFTLVFLCLCLGLGSLHIKNYLLLPRNHLAMLGLRNNKNIRLRGIIDNDPAYGALKISFDFRINEIISDEKAIPAKGIARVNVWNKESQFSYGDELILEGNLYKPFNFGKESNFSYRDYLRGRGIAYILNVKRTGRIIFLAGGNGSFLKSLAFKIKHKFKGIFKQYLWPINSDVLSAIILGERQNFPEGLRQIFIWTGTVHIIAISGFHVGIVAFIILIFLKAIGIRGKGRYLITIPLLIIHMLAVGAGSSVARATLMALIVLIAFLIGREPHIINSLSLAALFILGYNPLQIFDIGFQLSFVSVLGIVVLSPKIILGAASLTRLRLEKKANVFLRAILNSFSVSLAAWLATFGFIIYYFRIISPVTILANLIIVPLVSLAIILGWTLSLSAMACPVLSPSIAATTNFVLVFLFKITHCLSRLPFAYFYLY